MTDRTHLALPEDSRGNGHRDRGGSAAGGAPSYASSSHEQRSFDDEINRGRRLLSIIGRGGEARSPSPLTRVPNTTEARPLFETGNSTSLQQPLHTLAAGQSQSTQLVPEAESESQPRGSAANPISGDKYPQENLKTRNNSNGRIHNQDNNNHQGQQNRESQQRQPHHHHHHHHHHNHHHYHRPHFNSVVFEPTNGPRLFWQANPSQRSIMAENGGRTSGNFLRPGDQPVAIDIEPASSPSHDRSETSSLSPQMLSALGRRARRLTASSNYQDLQKIVGAEPGVDLRQEIDLDLYTESGITVVDFDKELLTQTEHNNLSLPEFLNQPRPSWAKVRWINVNGLSFDVIRALGQYKALHRLAIEDLMNTDARPKVDYYSDHTFIQLTLQKLVDIHRAVSPEELKKRRSFWAKLAGFRAPKADSDDEDECEQILAEGDGSEQKKLTSLQHRYGKPNLERITYMERHSSLANKNLVVSIEQVGIFLLEDTIISFFENSGDDIEPPILERLQSTNTLLRSSEDASMVVQAILDAIVDLSFPIVHAYQDAIGDLELHVLTEPSIEHTSALYIITSELSMLKTTLQPVLLAINALRDHTRDQQYRKSEGASVTSVDMSSLANTYLGDVQDHCVMLLDMVETMKRSADNLTDLLFNIIGNFQNESMKTLTLVTVLFLPMSFLTGYFGMNFHDFRSINNSETYCGIPVAVATMLLLMYDKIKRGFILMFRKHQIKKVRQARVAKDAMEKAKLKRMGTFRTSTSSRRSGDNRRSSEAHTTGATLTMSVRPPTYTTTPQKDKEKGPTLGNKL